LSRLQVRFYKQRSENDCGAAALKMVLQYYSHNTQFSPARFFRKRAEKEPYGSGNYRITTGEIVVAAKDRSFSAGWRRVSPVLPELIQQVTHFVHTLATPLIACQRVSDREYLCGHFRVIVGIEDAGVVLHDPYSTTLRWGWEKLSDYWRTTGANVTGGVSIWIAKRPIDGNLLLPNDPNPWDSSIWRPTPC
jgi:ABC-type bacteriocin/lantibiotic exporter with double-glycine peptidase domain